MKQTILAALLALVGSSSFAADYFIVVPVLGKTENISAINVALSPTNLGISVRVGKAYSYDFKQNLQVTGDPKYTGAGATWSTAGGALPTGLQLDATTGILSGTPSVSGTSTFNVAATYKTKVGAQDYSLQILPPAAVDPYFANVSVLMSFDSGLTDLKGHAVTPNGAVLWSAATSAIAPRPSSAKVGANAMYFPGSGQPFMVAADESLNLSGDFTIEFWVHLNGWNNYGRLIGAGQYYTPGQNAWFLSVNGNPASNPSLSLVTSVDATNAGFNTSGLPAGQWTHVAIVRSGMATNNTKVYFNGTQAGMGTMTMPFKTTNSSYPLFMGNVPGTGAETRGYFDELRITKGVARYTANFTVPTGEFPTE